MCVAIRAFSKIWYTNKDSQAFHRDTQPNGEIKFIENKYEVRSEGYRKEMAGKMEQI